MGTGGLYRVTVLIDMTFVAPFSVGPINACL